MGQQMVGPERTPHFIFGFGTALYLAWDIYSDVVIENQGAAVVTEYMNTHFASRKR